MTKNSIFEKYILDGPALHKTLGYLLDLAGLLEENTLEVIVQAGQLTILKADSPHTTKQACSCGCGKIKVKTVNW